MNIASPTLKNAVTLAIALAAGTGAGLFGMVSNAATIDQPAPSAAPNPPVSDTGTKVHLDRSGRKQIGKASFYAERYSGRTMADGTPMQLYGNNAASLTLPLGTTAKVTNLDTGKSAIVRIQDRGPYVAGRIIDLSPATAKLIGISKKQGLAPVEVTPISLPQPRSTVRLVSMNDR